MNIENINISNPCPEDTELMDGDGTTLHCEKCDKNVQNLSNLTREEAEAFLDSNLGRDICINYGVTRSGEIDFFQHGYPRPSQSQLSGVKKLLSAAVLVTLVVTQPAIVPAAVAVNEVYESVGTHDGLTDVISNIVKAESAMLKRLNEDFGFKTVEAKYAGEYHPNPDVTFR